MNATLKKLPHSQIELTFTIDPVKLEVARSAAFDKIASQVKVPGFRPGKAPKAMLEAHMNPGAAMQQALDEVLNEAYQAAIAEHSLVPISQPEINVESLQSTQPIPVTATIQVRPEPEIGDWKAISVAKESAAVDEAKVDETLKTIFARSQEQQSAESGKQEEGLVDAQGNPLTSPEKTEKPMDDAWAKTLGMESLESLRQQVKEDLQSHAEHEIQGKWQDAILDKLIDLTKVDLPPVFVEDELQRMRAHFEQQLSVMHINLAQYLEQAGKTEAELTEQWKPQAEKQATLEVALAEIAKAEKIEVTDAEVEAELATVDAKTRAQFADPQQRYYLTYSLWRQKVLRHLLEVVEKNIK